MRDIRKDFFIIFFGLIVVSGLAIGFGTSLLYDASDYILRIGYYKKILFHPDLRDIGFFLLHTPSVIYINFIGSDLRTLAKIFEFTHVGLPLLCLLINYLILSRDKKIVAVYNGIGLFCCYLFCFFALSYNITQD